MGAASKAAANRFFIVIKGYGQSEAPFRFITVQFSLADRRAV
jgi:hypothetical protein